MKNATTRKALNKFVGHWTTEGLILSHKNKEIKVSGTDTYEWLPGKFFLLHKANVRMGNNKSETFEVIGFDALKKHYTMQYYNNKGNSGLMTATVANKIWKFKGDTLRFKGGFNATYTAFSGIWEQLSGKKWIHFMNIKLTKRK